MFVHGREHLSACMGAGNIAVLAVRMQGLACSICQPAACMHCHCASMARGVSTWVHAGGRRYSNSRDSLAALRDQRMQDELKESLLTAERALLYALGFQFRRGAPKTSS